MPPQTYRGLPEARAVQVVQEPHIRDVLSKQVLGHPAGPVVPVVPEVPAQTPQRPRAAALRGWACLVGCAGLAAQAVVVGPVACWVDPAGTSLCPHCPSRAPFQLQPLVQIVRAALGGRP